VVGLGVGKEVDGTAVGCGVGKTLGTAVGFGEALSVGS
jgi:hypothetical protein